MLVRRAFLVFNVLLLSVACASKPSEQQPYTILKTNDVAGPSGGIPPDREAEIQLVLQQREVSTRKCYQDVLNEKNDRKFQGTVKVMIALETTGKARDVKVVGGTLGNKEVESCLVDTIMRFEFPQLTQAGDVQYEFMFRPAY